MKICGVCKQEKSFEDFNKKGNGYQGKCRPCQKEWYKNYYDSSPKEKARITALNAVRIGELRELIREAKSVPCADCKQSYPYYVMDFDHLRDKSFDISQAVVANKPKALVVAEIAKCEVVCSNCHRERTHQRR